MRPLSPRALARQHPLLTYLLLAYALSWCCWLPQLVTGSVVHQGDGWPTDLPGLAGPAAAALLTLGLTEARGRSRPGPGD